MTQTTAKNELLMRKKANQIVEQDRKDFERWFNKRGVVVSQLSMKEMLFAAWSDGVWHERLKELESENS